MVTLFTMIKWVPIKAVGDGEGAVA